MALSPVRQHCMLNNKRDSNTTQYVHELLIQKKVYDMLMQSCFNESLLHSYFLYTEVLSHKGREQNQETHGKLTIFLGSFKGWFNFNCYIY